MHASARGRQLRRRCVRAGRKVERLDLHGPLPAAMKSWSEAAVVSGLPTAASSCERRKNEAPGCVYERHKIGTTKVHRMETDVVCGMRVDPATAAGSASTTGRPTTSAARAACSAFRPTRRSTSIPRIALACTRCTRRRAPDARQDAARSPDLAPHGLARRTFAPSHHRTEYTCPMHPEVRQRGAGFVPDLRDGARARRSEHRGGAERRTHGHEPPLLVVARVDDADSRVHGVRVAARSAAASSRVAASDEVGRVRARDAGRDVGRMAVPRARHGVGHQRSPEHVHAHCDGRRSGVLLQRARDDRAGAVSCLVSSERRGCASISSPPRSSSCSCCSGKCSSCARAAGRVRRFAICSVSRRRRLVKSRQTGPSTTSRSSTCTSAIGSGSGLANTFRWTVSSSRA